MHEEYLTTASTPLPSATQRAGSKDGVMRLLHCDNELTLDEVIEMAKAKKNKARDAIFRFAAMFGIIWLFIFFSGASFAGFFIDTIDVTHEGVKYECRAFVDVSDVWEKQGAGLIMVNTVRLKRQSKCSDMHGPRIYGKSYSEVSDVIKSLNTKSTDFCYTMCISE